MTNPLVTTAPPDDFTWRDVENRFVNRIFLPLLVLQVLALSLFGREGQIAFVTVLNCAPSVALFVYLFRVVRTFYRDKREGRVSCDQ